MSKSLINTIDRGLSGNNEGLYNGLDRGNKLLYGILPRHYYLIGAESGAFKTTFTDWAFLLAPYAKHKLFKNPERKINWFYYSLELSQTQKEVTWLSYFIHLNEGVYIDKNKILGYQKNKLTKDEYELVKKWMPFIDEMVDNINLITYDENPTGIYNTLFDFAKTIGEIQYEEYTDSKGLKKKKPVGFTPNDPNEMTIIIVDHLAYLGQEQGLDTKRTMDLASRYFVKLRNLFDFTFAVVQQFNTGMQSVERLKFKEEKLAPQRVDYGDSTYTYRDQPVIELKIIYCVTYLLYIRLYLYEKIKYKQAGIYC